MPAEPMSKSSWGDSGGETVDMCDAEKVDCW